MIRTSRPGSVRRLTHSAIAHAMTFGPKGAQGFADGVRYIQLEASTEVAYMNGWRLRA